MAGVERGDQIGLDQMRAAADIDQAGARQMRQGPGVQHATGRRRQGQQTDHHLTRLEKGLDGSIERGDAGQILWCPAPAAHGKAVGGQAGGAGSAQLAQTQDADRSLPRQRRGQLAPDTLALLGLIGWHQAVIVQHPGEHELDHALGESLIAHACDRHVRQVTVLQDPIHPSADAQHRAQIGKLTQETVRLGPDDDVVDLVLRAAVGPDAPVEVRRGLIESRQPWLGPDAEAGEQHHRLAQSVHEIPAAASRVCPTAC